jgi:hypothetical protein
MSQKLFKHIARKYIRANMNKKPRDIFVGLKTILEENCPSIRTIYRWIDRFTNETSSLQDKFRSGHPLTKSTLENVRKIRGLVKKKPSITIQEINSKTKLSDGTIFNILHLRLKKNKISKMWI